MALDISAWDLAWMMSHAGIWALVFARVLGLCLTAPSLAVPELDWRFRLGLAAVLCAVLVPVLETLVVPPSSWSITSGVWAGLAEVLTGAVLGWSAALIVAGARLAGELVAAQAGFSTATLFDPVSGEEITPLGRLYGLIAMAVFLSMDGPLVLVRALGRELSSRTDGSALDLERDRRAGFRAGGPCLGAGALRRRAPRIGLDTGGHRHRLVGPRRAITSVHHTGAAAPRSPRYRLDLPQPDHSGRHILNGLEHGSLGDIELIDFVGQAFLPDIRSSCQAGKPDLH